MEIRAKKYLVLLDYVLVIFILLECNTVYSIFLSKAIINGVPLIIAFIIIVINSFLKNNNVRFKSSSIFFILLYLLFFLTLYYNSYNENSFLLKFGLIFPTCVLLCIAKNNRISELFDKFSNIITILSILSITLWLLVSVFRILPLNITIPISWGDTTNISGFYGLYFEGQQGLLFPRNTGIFPEAPMYNYVLCATFLYEYFIRKKSIFRQIIMAVTILTTTATTGLLCLIVAFFIKFFISNFHLRNDVNSFLKLIILPIGITLIGFGINSILSEKRNTDSYEVRNKKVSQGLDSWTKNPLLGNGYGKSGIGNSNSLVVILSDGGVVLLSFYLIPLLFIPLFFSRKKTNRNILPPMILFIFLFSITIVMYNIFTFLIIGFGYSKLLLKVNRKYYSINAIK